MVGLGLKILGPERDVGFDPPLGTIGSITYAECPPALLP